MEHTEAHTFERAGFDRAGDACAPPERPARTRVVRRWAPVAGVLVASVATQRLVLDGRYDVGGHAAEHLASASAPFFAVVVVTALARAEPRLLRAPAALLSALAWFGATVLVLVGNLRVVDELIATGHDDTPTGAVPDIVDHSLANAAPWLAVAASLALALACWRRRFVGTALAGGVALASLLVPPWILPGAGTIVLTATLVWRAIRGDRPAGRRAAPA